MRAKSSPVWSWYAVRLAFLALAAGSVIASMLLLRPEPLLIAGGVGVGVLCTLIAWAMSRIPAARTWAIFPVVFIQVVAIQAARSHYPGGGPLAITQFGGTALAIYGIGLMWLRLGVIGARPSSSAPH
jgi:hypothetical protein